MLHRTTIVKYMAPLIAVSIMLAALGVTAAWNVRHQQRTSSELIASEVHSLVAIHKMYMTMREARYQLSQYLRFEDEKHLDEIENQTQLAARMLAEFNYQIPEVRQRQKLVAVKQGLEAFQVEFRRARKLRDSDRRAVLERLADTQITQSILEPAEECVQLNEQVVTRTNERNREITRELTQGFLLLGLTGSIAGVIIGLVIARGLQRSLWKLHVSVTGAAGRLEEVIGPFEEPRTNAPTDLQSGMHELEQRITAVVERLHEREQEVARNDQLAAVGRLAAGLAHELRNPLTPMKLLVQAALGREDSVGLSGRQLRVIDQEISRMEQSIQSFLDFGRPPRVEKRRTDLRNVVSSAVDLVTGRSNVTDIELRWEVPSEAHELSVDPTQIRQVLVNVLLNALDAIGTHGYITIAIDSERPHPLGANPIRQELSLGTTIVVADNGPGFSVEQLPRIFEPFVTTKDTGSGLGLSISQRIVRAHGGEIVANNLPAGGASFTIWLPDTESFSAPRPEHVPYLE